MLHIPVRSTFTTTDPDEGRAHVATAYADNRMRVHGERGDFRLAQGRFDVGGVSIDTFENSLLTEYAVEPLERVLIVRMLAHEMEVRSEATERRLGPGDIGLIAQPDQNYEARVHGARMQLVGVDLGLVDEVVGGTAARPRRWSYEPLSPEHARHWQRTVDYVLSLLVDDDVATPLVVGNARRMLAAALVNGFGEQETETRADRDDARPPVVRRAVAYCEANPDLDIGVADVARAAHVSVRTLQLAFQRHLGTTPMAYLRRVRLDRARAALQEAGPDTATVTQIALRWGFADTSRFTAQYRAAYGELPSQTLRGR